MPYANEIQKFVDCYPQLSAIGNTPLVKLDMSWDIGDAEIYAKYEQLNPGGSIKDRPVLRMLAEAVITGKLTEDKTILDFSYSHFILYPRLFYSHVVYYVFMPRIQRIP